jgi:hypothetical protein
MTAHSSLKIKQHFEGTFRLHLQGLRQTRKQYEAGLFAACFVLVFCLAYSLTLKEIRRSSETSDGFQRTTRRYIPEDRTLHNHRCENLKSYIKFHVRQGPLFEVYLTHGISGVKPIPFSCESFGDCNRIQDLLNARLILYYTTCHNENHLKL